MIIHSLMVDGFKMIGSKLPLDFPESGRIGIQGVNESGKSTLLESVEYALYGPKRGAKVAKDETITWGKAKAKFYLEFSSGPKRYVVTREWTAKGGHTAMLAPISGGTVDKKNAITSIEEVRRAVETMTGMDRESYSKLVYVKQKDLDALKELKARREQLLNKIMGIEVFDGAVKLGKEMVSQESDELEKLKIRMESAGRKKDEYVKRLASLSGLSTKVEEAVPLLKKLEGEASLAKKKVDAFDWAAKKESTERLIDSKQSEFREVKARASRLSEAKKTLERNEEVIERYGDRLKALADMRTKFQDFEKARIDGESQLKTLEKQREEMARSKGLTESLSPEVLSNEKNGYNRRFLVTLVAGLGLTFAAFVLLPLVGIGLVLFGLAGYWWTKVRRLERTLASLSDLQGVSKQIRLVKAGLGTNEAELGKLQAASGFESGDEVERSVRSILSEVKSITDQETLEGLVAVTSTIRKQISQMESESPQRRENELSQELENLDSQLQFHLNSAPEEAAGLVYDEEAHRRAKEEFEKASLAANECNTGIVSDKRAIQQLQDGLDSLKVDYDAWPGLEMRKADLEHRIAVIEKAGQELAETAKELRSRVIPHAKLVISEILPKLTNGRYSDFEISEDLTFTVNAKGGYQPREIFSGGTQDQFLIALRLAFTKSILDSRIAADRYCLLMDECISSSDEYRRQGVFEVLNLMKETFPQIFLIAHEDISNFVDYHITLGRDDSGYTRVLSKSWES